MTAEKPKPKQLLRPITTGAGSAMNQSQFLAIICNSVEAREKSRVRGAIGFGFASHWLKNWRESFKPITKRSNRNHVITFASYLKTALSVNMIIESSVQQLRSHAERATKTSQTYIINNETQQFCTLSTRVLDISQPLSPYPANEMTCFEIV